MEQTIDVQEKNKKNVDLTKISVDIEIVTPESAKHYLTKNVSNRKVNTSQVAYYADCMSRDQWMLTPEGISFDRHGNLLDGQHRLLAIIKSGSNQRILVSRGFERETFKVINVGKNRSASDVFDIEDIKNARNVSSGVRKYYALKSPIQLLKQGNARLKLTNIDFLDEYSTSPELYQELVNVCSGLYAKLRIISISEILGYMIFLIKDRKHPKEKVIKFWTEVFTHSEVNAINELRQKILKSKMSNYKLNDNTKHVFIVKAWNTFVSGVDVKILKFTPETDNIPELL